MNVDLTSLDSKQLELEGRTLQVPFTEEMRFDRGVYSVGEYSIADISETGEKLGIPLALQKNISPPTLISMIKDIRYGKDMLAVIDVRTNEIAALIKDREKSRISISVVLSTLLEVMPHGVIEKEEVGLYKNSFMFVDPTTKEEIDGEDVSFGVIYMGSFVGQSIPKIYLGYFRGYCENGAIYGEQRAYISMKNKGADFADDLKKHVNLMMLAKEELLSDMQSSVDVKFECPVDELHKTFSRFKVSSYLKDYVIEAFYEAPGESLWDLSQAYTRAADLVPSHSFLLQSLGVALLGSGVECSKCHQKVS